MKTQATTVPTSKELPERWYLVDAEGQIVGRLAARIAKLVRGKTDALYSPHVNPNIHVVIVNADKVVFTGNKLTQKNYYHHSGWRTGIKSISAGDQLEKHPERVLEKAIYGMLPKGALGRQLNRNLRIYAGAEHPHAAQNPQPLEIKTRSAIEA